MSEHIAQAIEATIHGLLADHDISADSLIEHTAKRLGASALAELDEDTLSKMVGWLADTEPERAARALVARYMSWLEANRAFHAAVRGIASRELEASSQGQRLVVEEYHATVKERLGVRSLHQLTPEQLGAERQAVTLLDLQRIQFRLREQELAKQARQLAPPETTQDAPYVEDIRAPALESERSELLMELQDLLAAITETTSTGEWVVSSRDIDQFYAGHEVFALSDDGLAGLVGALGEMGRAERARFLLDSIQGRFRTDWQEVVVPGSERMLSGNPDGAAEQTPDLRTRINGAFRRPEDTITAHTH